MKGLHRSQGKQTGHSQLPTALVLAASLHPAPWPTFTFRTMIKCSYHPRSPQLPAQHPHVATLMFQPYKRQCTEQKALKCPLVSVCFSTWDSLSGIRTRDAFSGEPFLILCPLPSLLYPTRASLKALTGLLCHRFMGHCVLLTYGVLVPAQCR